MLYLKCTLIFFSIFFASIISIIFVARTKKNFRRINGFERKILWKVPQIYTYIYGLCPHIAKLLISKIKNRMLEEELLILLENMGSNLGGGVSVFETVKTLIPKIKAPLKNELSVFVLLSKEHGNIFALETCISRAENIFIKIMWTMILTHYKNGGAVSENIKRLHKALYTRINIKNRLSAQLLQTKTQIIAGTLLPYVLFMVLSLMYPELMSQIPSSSIGIGLIIFALLLHSVGVWFFIKITKFKMDDELNASMLFEYLCFSIKSGTSVLYAINDIKNFGIIEKELLVAVEKSKSTSELIENLSKAESQNIQSLLMMLKRSHNLGTAIGEELSFRARDIMEKLENKALRFQQIVAVKALLPMLFCVFPATYILILTPIIVELSNAHL